MTKLSLKARSELNCVLKGAGDGVVDTRLMFQEASAASRRPGRSPTRGSGLGGVVERFAMGSGAAAVVADVVGVHAESQDSPIAKGAEVIRATALSEPRRRTDESDFTGDSGVL
jgi:hypothetical protein